MTYLGPNGPLEQALLSNPAINNFQALANIYSPEALLVYSKAALAYLAIKQQLVLLGSDNANENFLTIAQQTADYLQVRKDRPARF